MQQAQYTVLNQYWGYKEFRGSQEEIITAVLEGKDVLAIMPTGGGKSLCYQVPALINEGLCIVVSPLIALIQDQVQSLKKRGIKSIALTGGIKQNELIDKLDNCVYGNYKFLYLSPERLQQELVLNRLQEMNVNLIAIDEAHCISQWGHDFRPAYLKCNVLATILPEVPIIALTATATPKVAEEIVQNLNLRSPSLFKDSFQRSNISYSVIFTEDKRFQLTQQLKSANGSAIVYVRNRRVSVVLAEYLNSKELAADYFHGGLTRNEKQDKLKVWSTSDNRIMVATNAFGMGIDKANVRTVVHYHLPENLESYFQETGRAGRDGIASKAVLLTNSEDIAQAKNQFVTRLPEISFIKKVYRKLNAHLQIAYGEGSQESYGLNYNDFCTKYDLDMLKVYGALKILDQNSIISSSPSFRPKTKLQFTASKGELFTFFEKNPSTKEIIQSIARTYGGIFDFETTIDLRLISNKTGVSPKTVENVLSHLEKQQLASFTSGHDDLGITFLVPREDERTISPIAPKLRVLNRRKTEAFKNVLNFIENKKLCRTRFLLEYFGEATPVGCGTCDICIEKTEESIPLAHIKSEVLDLLQKGPSTSKSIIEQIPIPKNRILNALRELLEEEQIIVDQRNRYVKK